eukprot:4806769-Amphidinium_carterae.1
MRYLSRFTTPSDSRSSRNLPFPVLKRFMAWRSVSLGSLCATSYADWALFMPRIMRGESSSGG